MGDRRNRLLSFPTLLIGNPGLFPCGAHDSALSFPTLLIGNPRLFPMQGHMNEGTEEKDTGFPLTLSPTFVIGETGGNDSGDRRACGL